MKSVNVIAIQKTILGPWSSWLSYPEKKVELTDIFTH